MFIVIFVLIVRVKIMASKGTYILLYRKITQRDWYKNVPVKTVFIHCIMKANWTDKMYKGEVVKRGTFITSRRKLADETGLTEREVRTALEILVDNKMIDKIPSKSNTLVIVLNYDLYQKNDEICADLASHKTSQCVTQCAMPENTLNKGFLDDGEQYVTHQTTTTNKNINNNKEKRYAQIAQSASDCDTQNSGVILENAFDREHAFNEFWKAYPKKRDKKKSHIKFLSVCKNEQVYKSIMDGLGKQVASADWLKNNGQYIPYPTTWLNGERWNDEVDEFNTSSSREIKAGDW